MTNEVRVRVVATDEATPKLKNVQASAKTLGGELSQFSTLAKATLGGAAVAAAVSFGKTIITAASNTSESLNKVRVVFGDSSKSIESFAKDAAQNLGLSRQATLEAAGTFGNLFTAMGLGRPVAADMSTSIIKLAADLASFNNIRPEDALEKLRAGLVGEVEPLRTLGVNLNAADIASRAVAMGLAKQGQELNAAQKAQAAYAIILEQTKTAQGDYARTAGGMANETRALTAEINDLESKLGTLALPAATLGLKGLVNGLRNANDIADATSDTYHIFPEVFRNLAAQLGLTSTHLDAAKVKVGAVGIGMINAANQTDFFTESVTALQRHLSGIDASAISQTANAMSALVDSQVKSLRSTEENNVAKEKAIGVLRDLIATGHDANEATDVAIIKDYDAAMSAKAQAQGRRETTEAASAYAKTLPGMVSALYEEANATSMQTEAKRIYNQQMGIAVDLEGNAIPTMRELVNQQLDSIDASERQTTARRLAAMARGIETDSEGNAIPTLQQLVRTQLDSVNASIRQSQAALQLGQIAFPKLVEQAKQQILESQLMAKAQKQANEELGITDDTARSAAKGLDVLATSTKSAADVAKDLAAAYGGIGLNPNGSVQYAAKAGLTGSTYSAPGGSVSFFSGGGGGSRKAPVRSYARGTSYVPRSGLAYIHQGEAVLTKEQNAQRGNESKTIQIFGNVYFGSGSSSGGGLDDLVMARLN